MHCIIPDGSLHHSIRAPNRLLKLKVQRSGLPDQSFEGQGLAFLKRKEFTLFL
jgi:hypothetical protein